MPTYSIYVKTSQNVGLIVAANKAGYSPEQYISRLVAIELKQKEEEKHD